MTNCNFTNNTSINGGAFYWDNNALYGAVDNCSFINNTGSDGGAIYWYGANGTMTNCNFTNNKGSNGGAINWQRTFGIINNCNFINNFADSNGGAIYWEGTNGTESNCSFINNTAEVNGGAIYWYGANGNIFDCSFMNNNATTNAGAVYFSCAANMTNCALVNNIAPSGSEIYIYADSPNLNYNWWGSNNPNWTNLINGSYVPSVYAVLNVTAEPNEIFTSEKSNITTKFVWNGTNTDATNLLPERNVELTSNGTLTENEGDVGLTSEFSAATEGIYCVNTTLDNEILGVDVIVSVSTKKNLNISANAEPIAVGENVTIIVTGFENATGNVTARVQGGICSAPIVGGNATIIVSGIELNTTATIYYAGDDNYNPVSTTVNITVKPKSDVNIVAENVTKYYGGPERFVANIYDSELNPIVNKSVNITINGITYTRNTDVNGTVSLAINLGSGTYNVTTTVNNTTVESSITVLSTAIGKDITKYYKNKTQYSVQVYDTNGKAVGAGEIVTFNINGVFYNRTTDASGIATLNINLPQGDYIITADYKGCKVANNIKVLPVLKTEDITMKYMDGTKFVATLVDGQGNPYKDQYVTFNVNGIFYNRLTNSSGQAALNIRLPPGEHIITSSFNGACVANKITVIGLL